VSVLHGQIGSVSQVVCPQVLAEAERCIRGPAWGDATVPTSLLYG